MAISSPMRRRPNVPLLILGAVLALLGFVGAVLIAQAAARGGAATNANGAATVTVVVAAHDISGRTILAKSDLTTAQLSSVPGALTKVDDAVGMEVQIGLKQGQPVLNTMLSKGSDLTSSPTAYLPLPKGLVAFTIPTGEQQGVAGYIQAGDYIDIVAEISRPTGGVGVRTIYSSIHVIRVGPAPPEQVNATGTTSLQRGGIASSLTLAVSQCQAEYLNWFVANATLKYTLLSSLDYQPDATAPDSTCAVSGSPKGITDADIRTRWPGLI
jgi:Flp pilus assembly protein CpaB